MEEANRDLAVSILCCLFSVTAKAANPSRLGY
jgi:hypothetical protein